MLIFCKFFYEVLFRNTLIGGKCHLSFIYFNIDLSYKYTSGRGGDIMFTIRGGHMTINLYI